MFITSRLMLGVHALSLILRPLTFVAGVNPSPYQQMNISVARA